MVLPSGFVLPPLLYLIVILVSLAIVIALLVRDHPPVTELTVIAFVPWMVVGAALHALYQLDVAPQVITPLLGTPSVYFSTATVGGAVWLVARQTDQDAVLLGSTGTAAAILVIGWLFIAAPSVDLVWSGIGLVIGGLVAALTWRGLKQVAPTAAVETGWVGGLVIVGHAIDAVSTAIGVDLFGYGERTPAARFILEIAGYFPTADLIGVGWLFVLVKLVVASLVVWMFADFTRKDPRQANLLLAGITSVGLGPGVHNLLLYAVA